MPNLSNIKLGKVNEVKCRKILLLKILKILARIYSKKIMSHIIVWWTKYKMITNYNIYKIITYKITLIKNDLILKNWKNLLEPKIIKM